MPPDTLLRKRLLDQTSPAGAFAAKNSGWIGAASSMPGQPDSSVTGGVARPKSPRPWLNRPHPSGSGRGEFTIAITFGLKFQFFFGRNF